MSTESQMNCNRSRSTSAFETGIRGRDEDNSDDTSWTDEVRQIIITVGLRNFEYLLAMPESMIVDVKETLRYGLTRHCCLARPGWWRNNHNDT